MTGLSGLSGLSAFMEPPAVGGLITVISDTFAGVDAQDISTRLPDVNNGNGWLTGFFYFQSGRAYRTATFDGASLINSGYADGECQVSLYTVDTMYNAGLAFRGINNLNYLLAYTNEDAGYLRLDHYDDGVYTQLGVYNTGIFGTPSTIRVVFNGQNIKVYLNGVLRIDVNSSTNQAGTRHGIFAGFNNTQFDNFSFERYG